MKTVYAPGIGPGKYGTDRNGPRGDYQVIEGLPPFFLFRERPDKDTAVLQIDLGDFMQDTGIDAVFIPKFFRRDGNELPDIVDNLADIIGNASGRVGCMGPFLEGYDVQVRLQPFCLGRRAHSGGIPADDNKSFSRHISFTSIQKRILFPVDAYFSLVHLPIRNIMDARNALNITICNLAWQEEGCRILRALKIC
jgi:hypothetical protein